MRGFQPAKAKAKAQAFANGGPVRGPGTGTSDDIQDVVPKGTYVMPADTTAAMGEQALAGMGANGVPVNLSDGEFKLPPEQVHAVGVQALDQIKSATHIPVGFAPGAQQAQPGQEPEPRMFFADGGVVDEERRRPISPANIFPQGSPSAGVPVYQGAGFSAGQFGSSGQIAQVPASIGQQPGRQSAPAAPAPAPVGLPAAAPAAQVAPQASAPAADPQQGMAAFGFSPNLNRQAQRAPGATGAAPAPDPMLADAGKAPATLYMQDRAQEMRSQIGAGNYAGALGTAGRTAVQGLGMYGLDIANAVVNPALDFGGRMVGGALGTDTPSGQVRTDPATTQQVASAAPAAGGGRGAVNPAMANPLAPAPVAQPQAREVIPGIFRSGNSYGDSAQAAITGPTSRGLPTVENMARADALATGATGAGPGAVTGASTRGFGPGSSAGGAPSADAALSAAREAAAARGDMSAVRDSYLAQGQSFGGQTREGVASEDLKALALSPLGTPGRKAAQQMYAQQLQASIAREGQQVMRDGQQANTGIAQQRLGLEAGELGMKQQAAGFQARAAKRMEDLQTAYQAAKPAERAELASQMRALQGKTEHAKDNFMTVGGGQEWDTTANTMRNVPQRLIYLPTGQEVGARTAGAKPAPAVGSTSTVNGKTAVWNGTNWIPR